MPGVVYTREWVVDLVLDLAEYTADRDLCDGLVVEPSCGHGAFLRRIVERLCESAARAGKLDAPLLGGCLRAFDVDEDAVLASREVAVELLVRRGMRREDACGLSRTWIRLGDYLTSDLVGVRWVVGNPPYVRSSLIPEESRARYCRDLGCMTRGSDLYVGFFEKALSSLSEGGRLCFVCADRWLQNRYGTRLRAFVSEGYSLDAHVRMHGVDAFESEVSAYPAVSVLGRGTGRSVRYVECREGFSESDACEVRRWLASSDAAGAGAASTWDAAILPPLDGSAPVALATAERLGLLNDMTRRFPRLEEAGVRLGIGVASGCDEVYITDDPQLVEGERLLPLFFMRDWRAGKGTRKWLVDPWEADGSLVDLESYPKLRSYLEGNRGRLSRRRVARDHPEQWYRTLDKPDLTLLGKEMLLFPDMAARSEPVYSSGERYPHHNCYWLTSSEWEIKPLGGLLMSDLVEGYVDAFGVKMRGSTLRFQAQYLRLIHIPRACDVDEATKGELALAFETNDRERANLASRKAYGMETAHA